MHLVRALVFLVKTLIVRPFAPRAVLVVSFSFPVCASEVGVRNHCHAT